MVQPKPPQIPERSRPSADGQLQRLYLPPERLGGSVALSGEEAHYLLHVKRCRPGDPVELFTGDGTVYRAVVTEASRSRLTLTLEGSEPGGRECPVAVSIVVPVARGERMDTMVEKLSELGVAELWPVTTARSRVPASRRARADEVSASRRKRWGRIAIEAARQSGRATVLHIQDGQSLERAAEALRSRFAGADQPTGAQGGAGTRSPGPALQLVACLSGEPAPIVEVLAGHPLGDVAIFIGPEGDFDPAELAELTAGGALPVSLGPTVLRVETAAIVAAAAVVLWADAQVAHVRRAPTDGAEPRERTSP